MESTTLVQLLHLSLVLLIVSIWGLVVVRKNIISLLMALELLLLSASLNYVFFSVFLDDIVGQIFALFILATAGAESAIGLGIVVIFYRLKSDISIDMISSLKG